MPNPFADLKPMIRQPRRKPSKLWTVCILAACLACHIGLGFAGVHVYKQYDRPSKVKVGKPKKGVDDFEATTAKPG